MAWLPAWWPCVRLGTPPWPGSHSPITPANIRLWRKPWRWPHERRANASGRSAPDVLRGRLHGLVRGDGGHSLRGPSHGLVSAPADAGAIGAIRRVPRHWHCRHRALAEPPVDGSPFASSLRALAFVWRTNHALQGLLDLRLRAACRVDRARDRHWNAHPGWLLEARRGGRSRYGPLSGLRIPVRRRQRRRVPTQ